jgi:hypothetical protein
MKYNGNHVHLHACLEGSFKRYLLNIYRSEERLKKEEEENMCWVKCNTRIQCPVGCNTYNSLYIIQPSNTTSNMYLIINEWATSFGH